MAVPGLRSRDSPARVSGVTTTISLTKCGGKINSSTGVCEGLGFSFNDEIRLRLQSPTGTIVSLVSLLELLQVSSLGTR